MRPGGSADRGAPCHLLKLLERRESARQMHDGVAGKHLAGKPLNSTACRCAGFGAYEPDESRIAPGRSTGSSGGYFIADCDGTRVDSSPMKRSRVLAFQIGLLLLAGCDRASVELTHGSGSPVQKPTSPDILAGQGAAPNLHSATHVDQAVAIPAPLAEALAIAERDVGEAVAYLDLAYPGEQGVLARKHLITALIQNAPEKMQVLLGYLRSREERNSVIAAVAQHLARHSPSRAAAIAALITGWEKNLFLSRHVQELSRSGNHHSAANSVKLIEHSESRADAIETITRNWAMVDQPAALEWARRLQEPTERTGALLAIISAIGQKSGPDAVIGFMDEVDDPMVRQRGVEEVTRLLVRDGHIKEGLRWLESLSAELQGPGLLQLAHASAAADPDWWIAYARSLNDKRLGTDLISTAVSRTAEKNPVEAARIVQGLSSDQNTVAVIHLINYWFHADKDGLRKWVESLPQGDLKDKALARLAEKTSSPTVMILLPKSTTE